MKDNISRRNRRISKALAAVVVTAVIAATLCSCLFVGDGTSLSEDAPFAQTVLDLIEKYYYEDIDWSDLQYDLAAGIAGSIDQFTWLAQLSPINASSAQTGATIASNVYNEHYVTSVAANSPAATTIPYQVFDLVNGTMGDSGQALDILGSPGLKRGDEIVAIKSSPDAEQFTRVQNLPTASLTAIISGADVLDMQVYRYTYDEEGNRRAAYMFYIRLVKEVIHVDVASYLDGNDIGLGDDIGYISLKRFGDTAVDDFYAAANAFVSDESAPHKLILDLRGDPGGGSDILGFIASYFIPDGSDNVPLARYVYNAGYGQQAESWFYSQNSIASVKNEGETLHSFSFYQKVKEVTGKDFECAILTDSSTASSSELLTWTIDFYSPDGVQTVGTTTYGKGVAQAVFYLLDNTYELYVTNGRYYVPMKIGDGETTWDTSIHGVGISPLPQNVVSVTETRDYRYDEVIKRAVEVLAE